MATEGRLAALKPSATTDTVLYACPASTLTHCGVFICRQGGGDETVRVAIMNDATIGNLTAEDWIIYDDADTLQITGLILKADETLAVWVSAATVSFVVNGFEEAA